MNRKLATFPGYRRDDTQGFTRHTPLEPDLPGLILFSRLSEEQIDAAISEQIAYFRDLGRSFEWKVYDFDSPGDLKQRLLRRGFKAGDEEMFMLYDTKNHVPRPLPEGVRIQRVTTREGIREMVALQEKIHGDPLPWLEAVWTAALDRSAFFMARLGDEGVGTGRIEFPPDADFAELYGGAVAEPLRGRGIYSALFQARVEEARSRGVRYLTVDAAPMSRPILLKKGFKLICPTTPFMKQPI